MLGLADIKDWLKTLDTGAEHFYIGKLNNKEDKSLGVYQLRTTALPNIALGGLSNTKYDRKYISILIHWNKNAKDTEESSYKLYEIIQNAKNLMIGNKKVHYVELLTNEPVDVGTDINNVYERVIQAVFYYEK